MAQTQVCATLKSQTEVCVTGFHKRAFERCGTAPRTLKRKEAQFTKQGQP
jgi:hypothetical protein